MSACESRISPSRGEANFAKAVRPEIRSSKTSVRFNVYRFPVPMLMASPAAVFASQASRLARTTFVTYVKSRDCSPLPYTVGCVPLTKAVLNKDNTPEYGDLGSCRGPKTLKYRT